MSKDRPKNMAASVKARLTDLGRKQGEDFQLVLTRYAIERLLYRLARTPHAGEFVLKGAMLFRLWAEGRIAPRVTETFAFADGGKAIAKMAARGAIGKLVVEIG